MSYSTIQGTNEYRLAIKSGIVPNTFILQRKMEEVFFDNTGNPFIPVSVTHKWVDCETVIIDADEEE